MQILVLSPHPDDDVLGCGGSIAKYTVAGHEVSVVYLTSGGSGDPKIPEKKLMRIREKEAKASASILGVKNTFFLHLPDGYLEFNKEFLLRLIKTAREVQPDIVYIPQAEERHRDHRVANELCLEAAKRAGWGAFQEAGTPWNVKTILEYEVWNPMNDWNYVEDITNHMKKKLEALQAHKSQLKNLEYDKAIEGLNRYRGIVTGKGKYVEVFRILKTSRI